MQNIGFLIPRVVLNGVALGAVGLTAGIMAMPTTADAAKTRRILSCKDAIAVVKGAGYREIRTRSCNIPYAFTARRNNCTVFITVTASGRWTGIQGDCDTIIQDSSGF